MLKIFLSLSLVQSGGFLCRHFGPLLKTRLPLRQNIIKPLAKSVLIPFGLTAATSATDSGIHKNFLGCVRSSAPKTKTVIISNDKMK